MKPDILGETRRARSWRILASLVAFVSMAPVSSHAEERPTLRVGVLGATLSVDGVPDEADWASAPASADLVMVEPRQGGRPNGRGILKVLAGPRPWSSGSGARYLSPDLQLNSFLQYDTDSRTFGTNTRLRWTFHPRGDVFLIYNHNFRELADRWRRDSNELLVKVQYTLRR